MRQAADTLTIETQGQGLVEITGEVTGWLGRQSVRAGLLTLFCRHTSASLLIQENPARYRHNDEGPDDMPAHIRAALTAVSLQIPVLDRRLALGTWQGIYLFEHRHAPHARQIALHLI